jgi:hypothetical protein
MTSPTISKPAQQINVCTAGDSVQELFKKSRFVGLVKDPSRKKYTFLQ